MITWRSLMRTMGIITMAFMLQSCASSAENEGTVYGTAVPPTGEPTKTVAWPKDKLETGDDGSPILAVWIADEERLQNIDIETYVEGVLAGEMKNDWPLEALKAQAVLARTFVLKFVSEKQSKYDGADISTDIEEAQAYNASAVNDRIRQAVSETRGLALNSSGELPYAWFHAHSGGLTEFAKAGLNWKSAEPAYTRVAVGSEPEDTSSESDMRALKDAQAWEASFTAEEFQDACARQGVNITLDSGVGLTIGERGDSGRATALSIGDRSVNASELRLALGSTKMRSTLLTSLRFQDDSVYMAGKGYGHGVGMSQWGAYDMAHGGADAEAIIQHYFQNTTITRLW